MVCMKDLNKGYMYRNNVLTGKNVLTVWAILIILTLVYLSFLSTIQVVLFIEAAPVSTPLCLSSLLATANQMSQTGEIQHESRVYEQYINIIHD